MISSSSAPTPPTSLESAAVPPLRTREPYAVERLPTAPGFVKFVVYDGRGQFFAETVLRERLVTPGIADRMRAWAMKHDAGPTLSLV